MAGHDREVLTSYDKWDMDVRYEAQVIAGLTPEMEEALRALTRADYTMFGLYRKETPLTRHSVPLLTADTLWELLVMLEGCPGLRDDSGILIGGVQSRDGEVVCLSYYAQGFGQMLYTCVDDYSLSLSQALDTYRKHRQYLAGTYEFQHYDDAYLCAKEYRDALEDGRVYADGGSLVPGLFCEFYL